MGFDENKEKGQSSEGGGKHEERHQPLSRQPSESSVYATEEEEDEYGAKLELGPLCTLKEHLEKDKDDESLRKWKEQLLGSVDVNNIGEILEPEVKITSLSIISPGRDDIVLPIPEDGKPKGLWFTIKEGCLYRLKFTFEVSNNIVSGFKYTNTVWKTGVKDDFELTKCMNAHFSTAHKSDPHMRCLEHSITTIVVSVDSSKEMLGTFSPQLEPYTHEMPEETTPSGIFARGQYSARSRFVDDDNKCYLEINYTFDIRKEWA